MGDRPQIRCRLAAALLTALLLICRPTLAAPPNILFIFSDDHSCQAISAYGSELTTTPNIDRLAHDGVRFARCYVTNAICGPSRACVLTGKYSHANGFYRNSDRFDGSQPTFPKLLQQAGYQTALIGKWHLVSEPAGFDSWEVLQGQGRYYSPIFLTASGDQTVPGYCTDIITDKALCWLKTCRDASRPFLLMVQHKAPHRAWEPGPAHLREFAYRKFVEPKTLFDDYGNRSSASKKATMRISADMTLASDLKLAGASDPVARLRDRRMSPAERRLWHSVYDAKKKAFDASPPEGDELVRWKYQRYMQDYLASVASVDDSVGRLLDYLDESGLTENTIVVYASDQGFFLGEHGWFDKRFMYEPSLRAPLLVRWPGVAKAGTVEGRIVSNVDFAETFLEAAGIEIPSDMQGRSFVSLLKGQPPEDWRPTFYYHYYEGPPAEHTVAEHYGVTDGRFKLIHFYKLKQWEMFDLETDPDELHSIYGQPAYAADRTRLQGELQRLQEELKVDPNDPHQ